MIKTIWPYTKGYRFKSILAALTIIGEVLVEVSIPYMMADIVNIGIENKDTAFIIQRGIMMILMAIASLSLGALSARFASVSSAGFAKNLRGGLFERVQSFSFANGAKNCAFAHHNSRFNVDEDVLHMGAALYVNITERFLNN